MDLCYGSYNRKQHSRQSRDYVPTVAYATVQNEQTKRFRSYFSPREDPRCLLSRVHILPYASLWSFNTGLLLRTWWNEMHFLLLWQHWLVCLIPSFRTETAHSLLLPIQQSGPMVSPGETDVVRSRCCCTDGSFSWWWTKSTFHGVCDLECLVWSEIAGLYSLSL